MRKLGYGRKLIAPNKIQNKQTCNIIVCSLYSDLRNVRCGEFPLISRKTLNSHKGKYLLFTSNVSSPTGRKCLFLSSTAVLNNSLKATQVLIKPEMKSVILFFVLIEFIIVMLCDDFQQFNTTFTNLNVTYFNGNLISNAINHSNKCSVVVDSSANDIYNGTHKISYQNYTVTQRWAYAYNWTSNWTNTFQLE